MSDNIPLEIQTEIIQRIPDMKSVIRCRSVSKSWKSVIDSKDFVTAHTLRRHQAHPHHHLLIRKRDHHSEDRDLISDTIKVMSEIPFEIQTEIIQRITDIKSLMRCRSVSKAWKSMIDSEEFVNAHHQANRHLLTSKRDHLGDTQVKYVSIVDDGTFPNQKLSVFVPDSVNKLSNDSIILGCSHGLLCLYEYKTAVIWNPTIRKTVAVAVPNVFSKPHLSTVFGFGVCPSSLDPKLVKITYVSDWTKLQDVNTSTQVEVFTLSSGGTWRSPLSGNLPHKLIGFGSSQAVIDGVIYWLAFDRIDVDVEFRIHNLIMSFDLASEEFTKINLPDPLALNLRVDLLLTNLRESLAVLQFEFNEYDLRTYHVWQMIGHGCTRSFNRLYSINSHDASILTILGFRKSGAPIICVEIDDEDTLDALAIYEQESESITNIGIHGLDGTISVHSYMETLLLLGH